MVSRRFSRRWGQLIIAMVVTLLAMSLPTVGSAATSGEFDGSWVANGSRVQFPFSADREVYTFNLSGNVSLKTTVGNKKNYWSECVGFSDTVSGVVARCVWKDLDGSEIYLSLKSKPLQEGGEVIGTIVGGSNRLAGITGDLSFIWSSFSTQKEGGRSMIMGQTLDLKGNYQIP